MLELCLLNGRFLNSFRDWMRCSHDLLKTRTSFLFMLEGWSSVWVTFLWSSSCIMTWQRVLSVFKLYTKHPDEAVLYIISTSKTSQSSPQNPNTWTGSSERLFRLSSSPAIWTGTKAMSSGGHGNLPLPHTRTDKTCLLITKQHDSITLKALIFNLPYWPAWHATFSYYIT